MNLGVTLEIARNGLGRDVFEDESVAAQSLLVEFEGATVAGEDDKTAFCQDASATVEQLKVVALDVPYRLAHGLGVGEGGRIHKDQFESIALLGGSFEPCHGVGTLVHVVALGETVERHVASGPFQIRLGQIHRDRGGGSTCGGMDRGGSGIGEQVEDAFSGGEPLNHLASRAMVEEQAGVEIAVHVDLEAQTGLLRVEEEGLAILGIL